jgi:hypothetical protein
MKKFVLIISFQLFALVLFPQDSTLRWLQDYEILKRYLLEGYSNLDWIKKDSAVDILSLDKSTKEQLTSAKSKIEVKAILDKFLLAFQDGHLELLECNSSASSDEVKINANTTSAELCSRIGNEYVATNKFSLPFDQYEKFQLISSTEDPFPLGIIQMDNGKTYAVLRISVFVPEFYQRNCEAVWELYRTSIIAECYNECIDEFSLALANNLLDKLDKQLQKLENYKFEALIVDVGDNGGGSEWAEAIARTLSPKPLYAPNFMLVKQSRSVEIFKKRLAEVQNDLLRHDLSNKEKEILLSAKERLEALIREAQTICDNSNFWRSNSNIHNCKITTSSPFYASGVFSYMNINDIQNLKSKSILFSSSQYTYNESSYKGNIIVLVDRNTASAAEYFTALLKDNGVAMILGEKSYGAGGGFVDGGVDYVLPNTKFTLKMPNCTRLRKDGSNEFYGIESDFHVWDEDDDVDMRLRKILIALERIDF